MGGNAHVFGMCAVTAGAENHGTIETHLRPTRLAVPTGAAPVVMMIHHAVADLGFSLADGGTDRGDNAARFVPTDHMSVDAAHTRSRHAGFVFPPVRAKIRAAHTGCLNLQDDVARAGFGVREVH